MHCSVNINDVDSKAKKIILIMFFLCIARSVEVELELCGYYIVACHFEFHLFEENVKCKGVTVQTDLKCYVQMKHEMIMRTHVKKVL